MMHFRASYLVISVHTHVAKILRTRTLVNVCTFRLIGVPQPFEKPTSRKTSKHRAKHATYIDIECTQFELLREPESPAADPNRTRRPSQTHPSPYTHFCSAPTFQLSAYDQSAHYPAQYKSATPPRTHPHRHRSHCPAPASRPRHSVLKNEYHGVQALLLHRLARQDPRHLHIGPAAWVASRSSTPWFV